MGVRILVGRGDGHAFHQSHSPTHFVEYCVTTTLRSTVTNPEASPHMCPCRQRKRFAKLFGDVRELDDEGMFSLPENSQKVLVIEVAGAAGKGIDIESLLPIA